MERAVELVGFYHHVGAFTVEQVVGAVVLRDASEKGVAAHVALVQQVCGHRRGRRFAVCAGHAEPLHGAGECAEHFGALHDAELVVAEVGEFLVVVRNGGGVHHECALGASAGLGYEVGVVGVVNVGALGPQFFGQGARGAVVAAHNNALRQVVAHQGAHADAAGSYKVNCIHLVLLGLCRAGPSAWVVLPWLWVGCAICWQA